MILGVVVHLDSAIRQNRNWSWPIASCAISKPSFWAVCSAWGGLGGGGIHLEGPTRNPDTLAFVGLRTLFPLTAFKNARNPKFVQNLSQRLFWGVPVTGTEIWKNFSQNSKNGNFRTNFDKFFQISVPLTGTPQNNRWDKFWTNLGFRAFLKAVRGKRVRNSTNVLRHTSGSRISLYTNVCRESANRASVIVFKSRQLLN